MKNKSFIGRNMRFIWYWIVRYWGFIALPVFFSASLILILYINYFNTKKIESLQKDLSVVQDSLKTYQERIDSLRSKLIEIYENNVGAEKPQTPTLK